MSEGRTDSHNADLDLYHYGTQGAEAKGKALSLANGRCSGDHDL